MGAVCDWSIPSPSKPFFSHRHVQSVDKRHHPTDSLINCEMYSYLPLSYSRAPKTPPLLLFYPSVKGRNKLDSTRIFLLRKKKKNALLADFPFRDYYYFFFTPTQHTHCLVNTHVHHTQRHTRCLNAGMQGHKGKGSDHDSATGLKLCSWALCCAHTDTCPMHFSARIRQPDNYIILALNLMSKPSSHCSLFSLIKALYSLFKLSHHCAPGTVISAMKPLIHLWIVLCVV